MKEVYLLSGLGADKRVFDFLDLSAFDPKYIEWVERLLKQISGDQPILIGVSFGGIMSIEIGKLIGTEKIILISSAETRNEIPWYYRMIGRLGINRLMPTDLLKGVNQLTYWFFGVSDKKEKEMLRIIIKGTNTKFLKWALDKIMNWRNITNLPNVYRIHGTKDRVLPMTKAHYKLINGGHLVIVSRANEISRLLRETIST